MQIIVNDDDGATLTYDAVSLDVGAAVMHALSGTNPATYSRNTGACVCTSFNDRLTDGTCGVCNHPAHATRVYCGVMKR